MPPLLYFTAATSTHLQARQREICECRTCVGIPESPRPVVEPTGIEANAPQGFFCCAGNEGDRESVIREVSRCLSVTK